jgi:hypothetical protein
METRFEWDEEKNLSNQRKHGVSFEQAVLVFADPLVVSTRDREVDGEERWQTFGRVEGILLLLVAHTVTTEESGQEVIRMISARAAIGKDRRRYERKDG